MKCDADTVRASSRMQFRKAILLMLLSFAALPLAADDSCIIAVVDWIDEGMVTSSYGCVSVEKDRLLMAQSIVDSRALNPLSILIDEILLITPLTAVPFEPHELEATSFQKVAYDPYAAAPASCVGKASTSSMTKLDSKRKAAEKVAGLARLKAHKNPGRSSD